VRSVCDDVLATLCIATLVARSCRPCSPTCEVASTHHRSTSKSSLICCGLVWRLCNGRRALSAALLSDRVCCAPHACVWLLLYCAATPQDCALRAVLCRQQPPRAGPLRSRCPDARGKAARRRGRQRVSSVTGETHVASNELTPRGAGVVMGGWRVVELIKPDLFRPEVSRWTGHHPESLTHYVLRLGRYYCASCVFLSGAGRAAVGSTKGASDRRRTRYARLRLVAWAGRMVWDVEWPGPLADASRLYRYRRRLPIL
jgi:hypothetical protein